MKKEDSKIWANLLHLGTNMWVDWQVPLERYDEDIRKYTIDCGSYFLPADYLRFDESLWNELLERMVDAGMNMVLIDLGEGVRYDSHPEIGVRNSWSTTRLKKELEKVRKMGLEPIPKLNFSACHDHWMGKYSRCLSTDIYYGVCRDLIEETICLFDRPRFFHLGMDEETAWHQQVLKYQYIVVRDFDLWWHDLYFLVNEVEKRGVRAWVWADLIWDRKEEFLKKMPKSVVQSNWYYGKSFNSSVKTYNRALEKKINYVKAYLDLDKEGYKQIPTGSNHSHEENFPLTVKYCSKNISDSNLLGFLQTPWRWTTRDGDFYMRHLEAIDKVGKAIQWTRKCFNTTAR